MTATAFLDDIGAYLASKSYGTVGTSIFLSIEEESPDHVVCVYEYHGPPPEIMMGGDGTPPLENVKFQVVVRDPDYSVARTAANGIFKDLSKIQEMKLPDSNGVRYLSVEPLQSPYLLDRDEKQRAKVACNYMATKELS